LTQTAHEGAEFVDAAGKTYDAMGGGKAFQYFGQGDSFLNSIVNHLQKSVDKVVIDLNGASKGQTTVIRDFVKTLKKEEQDRIIYVQ